MNVTNARSAWPRGVLIALAALAATPALAQWSTDPAANLVVADADGEQVQAKFAPTADGGFYVSWFDNRNGDYDVYLQRLDAGGNELWPHNGILVADRDFSSTQDYGLDVDGDGNAVLAFRYNDSNDVAQILAQKVAPDGSLLWGDPGVFVSDDGGGANSPRITATADGDVAIAWSGSDGALDLQKLDASGSPLWGTGVSVVPSAGFFFVGEIHGDSAGNVIASMAAQPSFSDHELWAQKFAAADGAAMWGSDPVKVDDGTNGVLQFGNFPGFIPDGADGAVFVWYVVSGISGGDVRVQHLDASGTPAFAQNGVEASADSSQAHFEPSGSYDPTTGETYVVWRETDVATQGQIGVYAQRIDSTGARQWGDGGKVLVPLSTTDQTEMRALPAPDGFLAAWATGDAPNAMPIHVARLASDGSYVWAGDTVDISTEPVDAGRLTGAISTDGYAAYIWTADSSNFTGDLHAQNINMDGTLGPAAPDDTIFSSGFDPVN